MILSVEDVGIYKPSRWVCRHAMQKLQIQDAPSICFISANSWDAQAAARIESLLELRRPYGFPDPVWFAHHAKLSVHFARR